MKAKSILTPHSKLLRVSRRAALKTGAASLITLSAPALISSRAFSAPKTIKIGGAVPLSGPVAYWGISTMQGFVDGAAVARIGARPFATLADVPPQAVLLAPEDRICVTMLEMLNVEGIVLEPAGALSVDALPDLSAEIRGKTVVCLTSGGNFDFERLPEVKERAMRFTGTKKYFILRLPQRPGALRDFLEILGPDDDIARFEYLKKSARNFGTVLIGIETTSAGNISALFSRMQAAGFDYRDITLDETLANYLL